MNQEIFVIARITSGTPGGNSQVNGHTDHGVVTGAQEAHYFHVQAAKRRLIFFGGREKQ